ncbi:hypothetical protein QAD02_002991 [Eretmocerus hayati]|uniref:Uncharacterized protein n=1 Tax=Eretmocerus hayati TaxID=131215 RepID=A0ACC2NKW1_9HYME|nr:hypothetical protein QAD02_002991 [Eretmocerus hayati]
MAPRESGSAEGNFHSLSVDDIIYELFGKVCIQNSPSIWPVLEVHGGRDLLCNICSRFREERADVVTTQVNFDYLHEIDRSDLYVPCCRVCFSDFWLVKPIWECSECVSTEVGSEQCEIAVARAVQILETRQHPRKRQHWLNLPDEAFNFQVN